MIVWTIQDESYYEKQIINGYLEGNKEYVIDEFIEKYLWIMEQMKDRIKNYNGEFPIWTWLIKPDLRRAGYLERGTKGVLLEIELEEDEILISGFEEWNAILNNDYIFYNEEEENSIENGSKTISKEESWERIFNYENLRKEAYWNGANILQGTMGRVFVDKIKSKKCFVAR